MYLKVDVTNRTPQVDLTNYVQNGEWELLEAYMIRNVVYYPCCPEPFPDLTVTLKMRRKILYYMYNIVLPVSYHYLNIEIHKMIIIMINKNLRIIDTKLNRN